MYSVWESKIKMDMGMLYVHNHEVNQDAQAIWRELVAHQTNLTTATMMRQNLLAHLSTVKLDTSIWRGTYVGFLEISPTRCVSKKDIPLLRIIT